MLRIILLSLFALSFVACASNNSKNIAASAEYQEHYELIERIRR